MDYINIFKRIDITEEEYQKCYYFSNGYDYSEHDHRKQSNKKKNKLDNRIGKLAEIVAYKAISQLAEVTDPDFNIYDKKHKSWDADLFVTADGEEIPFHVKGQDVKQGEKFGVSWVFQWGNEGKRGGRDKIFDDDATGWVVFVSINEKRRVGSIRAIVAIEFLKKYGILYGEPVCKKFKDIKKVVYFSSLHKHFLNGCDGYVKQRELLSKGE